MPSGNLAPLRRKMLLCDFASVKRQIGHCESAAERERERERDLSGGGEKKKRRKGNHGISWESVLYGIQRGRETKEAYAELPSTLL